MVACQLDFCEMNRESVNFNAQFELLIDTMEKNGKIILFNALHLSPSSDFQSIWDLFLF